jgi:hypothetical protein
MRTLNSFPFTPKTNSLPDDSGRPGGQIATECDAPQSIKNITLFNLDPTSRLSKELSRIP